MKERYLLLKALHFLSFFLSLLKKKYMLEVLSSLVKWPESIAISLLKPRFNIILAFMTKSSNRGVFLLQDFRL
jgi:hypothetical protein